MTLVSVPGFKQELPEIFVEKMHWDNQIKEMISLPVVPLDVFKETRSQQDLSRYSCANFIKTQMRPQGSAGAGR